jgi:hypothetical protein
LGYKTLKRASKRHSERFARPSKIFVWGSRRQLVPCFFRQSPPLGRAFRQTFQGGFLVDTLCFPNEDFGRGTKEELRIFEALFKGVSTQLRARTIEKSFENRGFLLSIPPKSSFGRDTLLSKCSPQWGRLSKKTGD